MGGRGGAQDTDAAVDVIQRHRRQPCRIDAPCYFFTSWITSSSSITWSLPTFWGLCLTDAPHTSALKERGKRLRVTEEGGSSVLSRRSAAPLPQWHRRAEPFSSSVSVCAPVWPARSPEDDRHSTALTYRLIDELPFGDGGATRCLRSELMAAIRGGVLLQNGGKPRVIELARLKGN